ncbi:helix-turn-helix transcriptional regulator [Veillonella caviae]|uniref:helix-turn-helix domain-containing protein n=1 Tax=Veillonella caviae TaxID=248316 RepID=UPI002A910080|nr:helix-turn-helix transcriptional regulator [Veillonella caviae]MDY5253707.1 helix-turn-helix transcriptional regulator [Veillonella caviae]
MKANDLNTLGARIKAIRISKGLTMDAFAKLMETTKSSVSIWESNKGKPNNNRLMKIAEIGNISVDELLYNYSHDEVFTNITSIVKYLSDNNDKAFVFNLAVLIGELQPRINKLDYTSRLSILSIIYSYIEDERLRNELLFMIANDIKGK